MSRFDLHIQRLSSDEASDGSWCEFSERLQSKSQQSFFVTRVNDVAISFQGTTPPSDESDMATYLVVLVPPALVERVLSTSRISGTPGWIEDTLVEDYTMTNKILSLIHPRLVQGRVKLKGILIISGEPGFPRKNPVDLVLLDPRATTKGSIDELLIDLNGESLSFRHDCVLKVLAISNLTCSRESSIDTDHRIPSCPVCLHRIDPSHFSLPKPSNHQRCSTFCPFPNDIFLISNNQVSTCLNQRLLTPWELPSNCSACHAIQTRWNQSTISNKDDDLFCNRCAMQETLWVCLTCGFVGCGRYSQRHAAEHFDESHHPYSLELATLRIWNYASGEYAHRGDILECPSVRNRHPIPEYYDSARRRDSDTSACILEAQSDEGFAKANYEKEGTFAIFPSDSPKKATMIGEEYEALLQSALEDQAQHYEGEISKLRAVLTAEQIQGHKLSHKEMTHLESLNADIERFRLDIDHLGRRLLDAQAQEAGHRAASQRLLREQGIANEILRRIQEEILKEHEMGKLQVEELEQQVADLTGNLRMRHQISQNEELNNAQIFGTTSSTKPDAMRRSSKKGRRSVRK